MNKTFRKKLLFILKLYARINIFKIFNVLVRHQKMTLFTEVWSNSQMIRIKYINKKVAKYLTIKTTKLTKLKKSK